LHGQARGDGVLAQTVLLLRNVGLLPVILGWFKNIIGLYIFKAISSRS